MVICRKKVMFGSCKNLKQNQLQKKTSGSTNQHLFGVVEDNQKIIYK